MGSVVVSEMSAIVREAAHPLVPGDSVKAQIARAARRLGITWKRAETFWYGRPCAVRAEEADRLRHARRELHELQIKRLSAELDTLKARLNDMEGFACSRSGNIA